MGAPLDATATSKLSFVESMAQLDMIRDSELVGSTAITECGSIRKRPSIVIGGEPGALAAVRVVHSPRSAGGSRPGSPTTADSNVPPPKVRGAWRRKLFASGWTGPVDTVLSFGALISTVTYYGVFLRWNETRSDIPAPAPLSDPVLPYLPTVDCSAALSILVYGGLVAALKYVHNKPDLFLEYAQTHTLVIWVRMVALFLTPLEAPVGTVPLVDPIAYPDGAALVRDLFFSGHTATTFGLFIGVRRHDRAWKLAFGLVTLVTAIGVLIQKAHYTIDVFAAPFFVSAVHTFVVNTRQSVGTALAQPDKHQAAKHFHAPTPKAKKL